LVENNEEQPEPEFEPEPEEQPGPEHIQSSTTDEVGESESNQGVDDTENVESNIEEAESEGGKEGGLDADQESEEETTKTRAEAVNGEETGVDGDDSDGEGTTKLRIDDENAGDDSEGDKARVQRDESGDDESIEGDREMANDDDDDAEDSNPRDEKDELAKEIFGDSDEDDNFDVPEPVDYKESDEDDGDYGDTTKKLRRLAKNSKRKKKDTTDANEDEEGEPRKKKKKGSRKKKEGGESTPKKRRKSIADSGDESDPERATKSKEVEGDVPELDAALERIKKKRPAKPKDSALETAATLLIAKMDEAVELDLRANEAKQPAINKIRLLSEVTLGLNKQELYVRRFIELGGLRSIKNWLAPMPDGSLPNIKIREQLLGVLSRLPTPDFDKLKESEVGKVVMFLYKNENESRDNKRICKALIEKWSRPIFNISNDYGDLERIEEDERRLPRAAQEEIETPLDRLTRETIKDTRKHHASIPKRLAMDFVVRPKSGVYKTDTKTLSGGNKQLIAQREDKRIKQKLSKGKNPVGRKVLRAEKMSVEGRGYK
jgi:transcription factor SPN1